ncbi:SLAM family member 9 isoform X2 [Hippoglossus stenolepis]|uniref:SLAM family member 9 isoform X2 n=1 Tax=Hippoglossus stenolepis TaxID=195615 RepID=UPI001FAFC18C|nr:SLAM family member 9 isoform X2 [Hippoglossus stenolepis]
MVGGRLRCLSCCFTHSELLFHMLLLGVCLHDVGASGCDRTVHKQVGDTVEFSSCLSTVNVTVTEWKFNNLVVADMSLHVPEDRRFEGRVKMNLRNFSLTVTNLTLQDSGDFHFVSEANNKQRTTVIICLQVHEPLTPPDLSFNSTFHPSNESCSVSLECVSTLDSNVNYSWSVRNQTLVGPRLWYTIRRQDGKTKFTCTIFNSERSTSKTVTCDNSSSNSYEEKQKLIFFAGLAAGSVLIVGLVAVIGVCHCKQRPADLCCDRLSQSLRTNQSSDPPVHPDENQLQVYSSLLHGDNCIYESIRGDTEEGTRGDPEERSDYVNENPHSASGPL